MQFMANFKCNHTPSSVRAYLTRLHQCHFPPHFLQHHEIIVFPPIASLEAASDMAQHISIGAQNAYPAHSGAYTGEIGMQILEALHIGIVLIGHSERRMLCGESQEIIANKVAFFTKENMRVVYCVGEPLSVRKQGEKAVQEYLRAQFEGIMCEGGVISVAYEPIWAIGTGISASLEDIASTHAFLRLLTSAPLLYGGSVSPHNAKDILSTPNVDGVLVGSASLDVASFYAIMQSSF